MATVDNDEEVPYDNHCGQILNNCRKTVKETPI